jgi:hypothetical protein
MLVPAPGGSNPNPFKPTVHQNNIYKFCSFFTEKALCPSYKAQLINAIIWNILSSVLVTKEEARIGNWIYDHLQVVTTNKYNTVTDFHTTKHSTLDVLSMLSLVFVTFLNNGYSLTMFSLSVSLQWTDNCHTPDITVLQHT